MSIDDFEYHAVLHDGLLVGNGCRTPELRHGETDEIETRLGELRSRIIKVSPKDD